MVDFERKDITPCVICGKKLMAGGSFLFWRVRMERFAFDLTAVRRFDAMATLMGGSAQLADIFSPERKLATPMYDRTGLICDACAIRSCTPIMLIAESIQNNVPADPPT